MTCLSLSILYDSLINVLKDSEPISKKSKTNTQSEGQTAALLDLAINTGADVDLATCLAANDIDLGMLHIRAHVWLTLAF